MKRYNNFQKLLLSASVFLIVMMLGYILNRFFNGITYVDVMIFGIGKRSEFFLVLFPIIALIIFAIEYIFTSFAIDRDLFKFLKENQDRTFVIEAIMMLSLEMIAIVYYAMQITSNSESCDPNFLLATLLVVSATFAFMIFRILTNMRVVE